MIIPVVDLRTRIEKISFMDATSMFCLTYEDKLFLFALTYSKVMYRTTENDCGINANANHGVVKQHSLAAWTNLKKGMGVSFSRKTGDDIDPILLMSSISKSPF